MARFRQVLGIFELLLIVCLVECTHLTATRKHSSLKRRALNFEPRYDGQSLVYADKSSYRGLGSPLAAEVSLEPKLPTLVFEDFDEHIRLAQCSASRMSLAFHDIEQMERAQEAWGKHPEFLIVLSHLGCSDAGRHQPHSVSLLEANKSSKTLTLSSRPTSLRTCVHRLVIELGEHVNGRVASTQSVGARYDKALVPRQQPSIPAVGSSQVLSGTPTVSFPSATPTESPAGPSATGDISFSYQNRSIHSGDDFSVTCLDCTASGSLELVAGGFSMSSDGTDALTDFFENGYLELAATGVRANMSLELSLLPGFSASGNLIAVLPISRIKPISIAGLVTIGPTFQPTIPLSIALNSKVDISTGFTLEVPDNSRVFLDVGDIANSNTTGFNETQLQSLPLNINAPNLSFNLTTGFKPVVGLTAVVNESASAVSVKAGGNAGVYLDLPKLTTTVTALDNGTASCDPPSPSTSGTVYQDLINVIPSIELGGGYYWDVEAGFSAGGMAPNWDLHGGKDYPVFATSLPTACLKFDAKASGLASPSDAAKSAASPRADATSYGLWFFVLVSTCIISSGSFIMF